MQWYKYQLGFYTVPQDKTFVHLYIDTNILLSLYHFTADELEDLKKLSTLLQKRAAVLYVPEQTEIEFRRNRDNKIAGAMKRLRSQKVALQVQGSLRSSPSILRFSD